jgi:putative ABC transport system permease protein
MHPIVSALRHHKTAVILLSVEIALTCAIVTNALFLIRDRVSAMRATTGVATEELVWARTQGLDLGLPAPADAASPESLSQADLAALRAMPGVRSAVLANGLPLIGSYMSTNIYRKPGDKQSGADNVVIYIGTPGTVDTLGIDLAEGRDFNPGEYADYDPFKDDSAPPSAAIVTREMADVLWPGEDPIGKPLYLDDKNSQPTRVVGVARHLLDPTVGNGDGGDERNILLPSTTMHNNRMYVLRVDPASRDAVARDLPGVLAGIDPARLVNKHEVYAQTVKDAFRGDRAMVWLLLVVIACLLALTALGVVGLSSFWVQQRTHQIGVRRAVGATRRDILRHFLIENFLIVSLGIAAGSAAAVGLNVWLMHHYELARLPLAWLPSGALVLWALGLAAAVGPALRAAAVPPAMATRAN